MLTSASRFLSIFSLLLPICLVSAVEAKPQPPQAVVPAQIMSFKQWKTQQIVDAQNQVARFANKSLLIKSSDPNKVIISNEGDNLDELERQLKQARIRLEVSQGLTFEDYVSIYLAQYAKDKASLLALAGKLSPADVAEMLEYMSTKQPQQPTNAEPVVGGAPATPTASSSL